MVGCPGVDLVQGWCWLFSHTTSTEQGRCQVPDSISTLEGLESCIPASTGLFPRKVMSRPWAAIMAGDAGREPREVLCGCMDLAKADSRLSKGFRSQPSPTHGPSVQDGQMAGGCGGRDGWRREAACPALAIRPGVICASRANPAARPLLARCSASLSRLQQDPRTWLFPTEMAPIQPKLECKLREIPYPLRIEVAQSFLLLDRAFNSFLFRPVPPAAWGAITPDTTIH